MRRFIICLLALYVSVSASAQKKEIVKTGLNFGPLPSIAYDADKGFEYGAILQIFDYGDGHNYPNYDSKTYLEYSRYTKGSQLVQLRYDNKELIPDVRWCSALRISLDKAYDFYGFNGYSSYYDYARVEDGNSGNLFIFTPFYRYGRDEYLFKSELIGRINDRWQWEAGIFANYFKLGEIDYASINKGKDIGKQFPETEPTLYRKYVESGVIPEKDADGGLASGLRAGIVFDSRDKEGAPSSGIWAETHLAAALPGISETPYCRYSATWRQYLPVIGNNVLTFAYRLNYEGTIGSKVPFYALSYMTVMGEKCDLEGMGGYNTVRGIMRCRVLGLDMASYNAEFRWRFTSFSVGKQNIALGLSAFSDGTVVTRGVDIGALGNKAEKERPHITAGAGFRFIMNENFIVAAEYGTPLTHFMKDSPLYNQDGNGAFYVNLGYLF